MITEEARLPELEAVSHAERTRRMVALGQQAKNDPGAAALLQSLEKSREFFQRYLATLSCFGSRNGTQSLRALSDESRIVRGVAVRLVPFTCTDEQAAEALAAASHGIRMALLRGLVRHRRRAPIDIYLHHLASREDERLGELLPYGSASVVEQYVPRCRERWSSQDWARLTRHHPPIAARLLREQTAAQTEPNPRLRAHVNAVLSKLARGYADDALVLVRDLVRYESPAGIVWQSLTDRRPDAVIDLLLALESGGSASVNFISVVHRLTPEQLTGLLIYRPQFLGRPHTWLRRVSPDLRRVAYAAGRESWCNFEGVMYPATVGALPRDLREPEARRQLALPALATRPTQRLPYASFLPWEEARAILDPALRNPDPDLRGVAISAWIGSARYYPDYLAEVLAMVKARANEQDPVRRAMLTALASLPPSRWTNALLDDLGTILQDTLGAADLSPATASAAESLVVALISFHPEWSAPWLKQLVQSRGQVSLHGLENRLSDEHTRQIASHLMPVFAAWESRERERHLVSAASALGRRIRVLPKLMAMLERVVLSTKNKYLADSALRILREQSPERLTQLVPQLLEGDPSTVTLSVVYEYLHRKRQDLLSPYLGRQSYSGRFSTGRTRFVLPLYDGFHRWIPRQQDTFATTLRQVVSEGDRDIPTLLVALRQLAALPAIDHSYLIARASLEETRPAVRDAALRELAHLDKGEGIPVLLEAMGDTRARVAIYALRPALLEMPAERALTLLQAVPMRKVTVAKEVLRLMGELETPAVYLALLEMDRQPLHRDVRVALLRALWDHLEKPETWTVLNAAAVDADPAIAAGVIRIPVDRATADVQQKIVELLGLLLTHPDPKIRIDTLNRFAELPITDSKRVLLPPLLERLASLLPDECKAAAHAVFAIYAGNTVQDVITIGEAVARIKNDRRVLRITLEALQAALAVNRARQHRTVEAVLSALEGDPITAQYRAALAIAGLEWEAVAAYLIQLEQREELHPEALMAAAQAIEASVTRSNAISGLAVLEAALAPESRASLRRLAFAAFLGQTRTTSGWTDERRIRLARYRTDPSPLVAGAAQFTEPPPDGAP